MNFFERAVGLTVYNQTVVEPLVLTATLLLGAILLVLPRRYAVVPFILLASFLPLAQRVAIAEIDFNMVRILLLFGWVRLFLRGDYRGLKLGRLDYVFFAWVASASVIFAISRGTADTVIFRAGQSYDLIGLFVLFRFWVRDFDALRVSVVAVAYSAIVIAGFMSIEFFTGRNFFSVFGGVPEYTLVRDGRLRCQATFAHPIMAGSVGAGLAPLCLWLTLQPARRGLGAASFLATTAIVAFSASSGPLLGWMAGMGACALWALRSHIRILRWSVVAVLVLLHLVANRPLWAWIGAMNVVGASTSYHRVRLIDAAVHNFHEWALLGVESTAHWGFGLNDVTNQYILEGVRGGFLTLVLFVVLLAMSFRYVGAALRRLGSASALRAGTRRNAQMLCWAIGASLFVHAINFIGVSYFGQIQVFLVLSLVSAGSALAGAQALERTTGQTAYDPPATSRVRALLRPTAAGASTS